MNTQLLALQLMAAQGVLGAFDTLYHHELTEALPQRQSARLELSIHAVRASIYSLLFIGLSAWQWHGMWALLLVAIFIVEILLTLWDFVIEDKTRLLPATERVTHTILAINSGAFIMLLLLNAAAWLREPSALVWDFHGYLSVFLALCGIGVGVSGLRDGLAARQLGKLATRTAAVLGINFGPPGQRILITGGTGFIGQLLVRYLLADGQQVWVLSRNPKAAAWLFSGKIIAVSSPAELPVAVPMDLVINLAGARILGWRWSKKRQAQLRASRIDLTEQLVRWIASVPIKPKLLLSASAIGYYGIQPQGDEQELTEISPPQNIFMSQLCAAWEASAHQASAGGVPVAIMRFGLVLGEQGALPMMLLPIKLGLGGALGGGRQWVSWIHVTDLLRAMAHVWRQYQHAEAPLVSVYNFTAPQAISQLEFYRAAARIMKRPCILPTPAWPMRLLLGEQADLLLEGQRVVPQALVASGFEFNYADIDAALKSLL